MRHHYVPQFLLRRWTNASGKLRTYTIRDGRLTFRDLGPKFTGYENGLYAIVSAAFGFPADHLERRLFGPIDNDAARALEKIERRETLSEGDHIAWTFFLCSLRIRQPDVLEFLRTEGRKHQREILAELDKETIPPGDPTTDEWFDLHFPGGLDAASLTSWLPRMILHEEVLDRFGGLHWWCREFEPGAPKLLLSDFPLYSNGGFAQPGFHIHLPIGPNRIFFGTASADTEKALSQLPVQELIERVNRATLASSTQRIWGTIEADGRAFVEANVDLIGLDVVPFRSFAPWNRPDQHGCADPARQGAAHEE